MGNKFWRFSTSLADQAKPGLDTLAHGTSQYAPMASGAIGRIFSFASPETLDALASHVARQQANSIFAHSLMAAGQARNAGFGPGIEAAFGLDAANRANQASQDIYSQMTGPEAQQNALLKALGVYDQQALLPGQILSSTAGAAGVGPYHPPKQQSALGGILGGVAGALGQGWANSLF